MAEDLQDYEAVSVYFLDDGDREALLAEHAEFDASEFERAAAAAHLAWLAPDDLEPLPPGLARKIVADARAFLHPDVA